jgi:hypothetical protein
MENMGISAPLAQASVGCRRNIGGNEEINET